MDIWEEKRLKRYDADVSYYETGCKGSEKTTINYCFFRDIIPIYCFSEVKKVGRGL